jgi:hypothetical protein
VNGGQTWSPITADTDNLKQLNDVFFQDATRGWIVGNNGLILRSNNGGATWTRVLPTPTTANLQSVHFPRNHTGTSPPNDPYGWGWAVGDGGTILGSRDFGQSWRLQVPFATTDPLLGVARRDKTHAIAVGSNNATLNTVASADSAVWVLSPPPVPVRELHRGVLVGLERGAGPRVGGRQAHRHVAAGRPVVDRRRRHVDEPGPAFVGAALGQRARGHLLPRRPAWVRGRRAGTRPSTPRRGADDPRQARPPARVSR